MAMESATPEPQVSEAEKHILDWDRIYLDLAPRVYNYFRYRLGRERDVEDLTSRAFEKAWAARQQYRRDLAGFSTWLQQFAGHGRYVRKHTTHRISRCGFGHRRCLQSGALLSCRRAPVN
jgi:DNA-directed RNA polymerase specialized sigma24 family protein